MSNRFYTIMVIPEKTSNVRKIIIPAWLFRGIAVGIAFVSLLAVVMLLDYWYVMSQIGETKQLKLENRRLKQQVQVFKSKLATIENTMERVKTFTTRLKVITNIEDRSGLLQSLNSGTLPDAATNIGAPVPSSTPLAGASPAPLASGAPVVMGPQPVTTPDPDPDDALLQQEYDAMEDRFSLLNKDSLFVEQTLQDQYELLADRKALLAALPVRRPAVGYFTSGFGVRTSPFGGRVKMHEGLDIANRPGTLIRAPADAVVIHSGARAGYGQTVILDHGYGLETWYGHLRASSVKKGQKVKRGDTIAQLGNSGRSTGPHVHYEVRVHGTPVDPLSYILEN